MIADRSNEFPVDLDQDEQGCLVVTDAKLLIRPARPGQYHRDAWYDTARVYWILDLGRYDASYITHIVTDVTAVRAHRRLDRLFSNFVNDYCKAKIWVDSRVNYIGAGGKVLHTASYGMEDGSYELNINVYCKDFMPDASDWRNLLGYVVNQEPDQPVGRDDLEAYLATQNGPGHTTPIVVVRPAPETETADGFTARGFNVTVG
jgi:hypothetical protein